MSVFDVREPWKEGKLFMKEQEFTALSQVVAEDNLVLMIMRACDVADSAIIKMMGKL